MNREIKHFVDSFLKEVEEENAAIFAGAGLSVPAGYVNWKDLLRPLADELDLDIDKEHDLISLAQYHCNKQSGNRHSLNQKLLDEFSAENSPTENHRILARLPISTYWTTNYDQLIETALKDAGKRPDIKYTVPQLATTKPKRDAIIYKMHGDIDHPDQAVITKDDYEKYASERGAFINALSGDLVSKTFLFLGFSFTDPNLDYILSRVRITFQKNQRRHYCVFKKRIKQPDESEKDFLHEKTRQNLAIEDLKRFNIKTLLVNDYPEITDILRHIEKRYRRRTIFISGSAHEYGEWSRESTEEFLYTLSKALIEQKFKIATGVGLGVGNSIITGAIEGIYRSKNGHIEDDLIMRPFPLAVSDDNERAKIWKEYRRDIISRAGIAIFILGNKLSADKVIPADGMKQEFEIARELGLTVVPVGASEYISRELWEQVEGDFDNFYPGASKELKNAFSDLGEKTDNPMNLVSRILEFINLLIRE